MSSTFLTCHFRVVCSLQPQCCLFTSATKLSVHLATCVVCSLTHIVLSVHVSHSVLSVLNCQSHFHVWLNHFCFVLGWPIRSTSWQISANSGVLFWGDLCYWQGLSPTFSPSISLIYSPCIFRKSWTHLVDGVFFRIKQHNDEKIKTKRINHINHMILTAKMCISIYKKTNSFLPLSIVFEIQLWLWYV